MTKKITITLDMEADTTTVHVEGVPGHGGIYRADSYRVRKYVDVQKMMSRWAGIMDGDPEGMDAHNAFMSELILQYGPRVANAISQLMIADMAWTEEDDARWQRPHEESW